MLSGRQPCCRKGGGLCFYRLGVPVMICIRIMPNGVENFSDLSVRFNGRGFMSRKDTIIVALLINAGLLALLFMLAINTEDDSVTDFPEITKALETKSSVEVVASNKNIAMAAPVQPISQ